MKYLFGAGNGRQNLSGRFAVDIQNIVGDIIPALIQHFDHIDILLGVQLSWKEHETAIKQLVSLNNVEMKDKITHLENLLEVKVDSKVATALYEEILKNVGK